MIAVAAAIIVWRLQVFELHEDLAWLVYCAMRILDGAALYRDLVEINTPIVVFLYVPVVLLQRLTGWSFDLSVLLYVTAVLLAAIQGTARMLDTERYGPGERTLLLWLIFLLNLVLTGHSYGQKEHFALLLMVPFLVHFAATWAGRSGRGRAAALAAGLGFAIKPHFVAIWAALALLALLRGRRSRLDIIADLAIAGAAMVWIYVLTFWLAPGFVALSLGLTAKIYVNLANLPYMAVLPLLTGLLPLALILPLLIKWVVGVQLRDLCDRLDAVLFVTAIVFVLIFAVQLKNFLYQLLPALLLGYFLAFKLVWAMGQRWWQAGRSLAGAAALALALALTVPWPLYTSQFLYKRHTAAKAEANPAKRYLRQELAGRSLFVLSSRFFPLFPSILYADVHLASRYPSQWIHPIARSIARRAAVAGGSCAGRRNAGSGAPAATPRRRRYPARPARVSDLLFRQQAGAAPADLLQSEILPARSRFPPALRGLRQDPRRQRHDRLPAHRGAVKQVARRRKPLCRGQSMSKTIKSIKTTLYMLRPLNNDPCITRNGRA